MGIQPPSDIVLDVMQAADPRKAQTVAGNLQRLSAMVSGGAAGGGSFGTMLSSSGVTSSGGLAYSTTTAVGLRNNTALSQMSGPARDAALAAAGNAKAAANNPYQKFEAMVLSTFVETMLPKDSSVFGSGNAGQIWRSMLAQKVSDEVAQAGGIGIAARIAAKHADTDAPVSAANGASASSVTDPVSKSDV